MDYHIDTDQMVVAGDTHDPDLRGNTFTTTDGTAIIIAHGGSCVGQLWGKAV